MFSVIIPLYNKSTYIEKCLQSVFDQTFQDFEVIVLNDGSTDDGPEKVQRIMAQGAEHRAQGTGYRAQSSESVVHPKHSQPPSETSTRNSEPGTGNPEPGTRNQEPGTRNTNQHSAPTITLLNQPNQGVSTARNNGVKTASHDYIAFLDADDWWDEHYLEAMAELIKKYPDAGLYGCKYKQVKFGRETEAKIGTPSGFTDGYINYFAVYAKTMWMPMCICSSIISRQIFDEVRGFNHRLKLGEDFDLYLKIALKHKVAYLNRSLVFYNQDVEVKDRAVNYYRLYEPGSHYLFNLDHLEEEEKKSSSLKKLLDNLRLQGLLRYHLSDIYKNEANKILEKINLREYSFTVKLKYKFPVSLIRFYQNCRVKGSSMKQFILRNFFLRIKSLKSSK
jgi:glycosyltransferase involved in cell wall biosynthesis